MLPVAKRSDGRTEASQGRGVWRTLIFARTVSFGWCFSEK